MMLQKVFHCSVTPLHWIYDQDKVASLIQKEKGIPDFYPTSQCPFYTVPVGSNSTYGDQLYVTLKNIAENKGRATLWCRLLADNTGGH